MRLIASIALAALLASPAAAQVPDLDNLLPPGDPSVSGRIIQYVALLTVLSLAPGILIMVTSFTRFVIAFSFLRSGLGLQSTPANLVLVSLALFLTFFVMAPVFDKAKTEGLDPYMAGQITDEEAYERISFAADRRLLEERKLDPLPFMVDAAFRVIFGSTDIDFRRLRAKELEELTAAIASEANKRIGSDLVRHVLLQQLNFVRREDIRTNWIGNGNGAE